MSIELKQKQILERKSRKMQKMHTKSKKICFKYCILKNNVL